MFKKLFISISLLFFAVFSLSSHANDSSGIRPCADGAFLFSFADHFYKKVVKKTPEGFSFQKIKRISTDLKTLGSSEFRGHPLFGASGAVKHEGFSYVTSLGGFTSFELRYEGSHNYEIPREQMTTEQSQWHEYHIVLTTAENLGRDGARISHLFSNILEGLGLSPNNYVQTEGSDEYGDYLQDTIRLDAKATDISLLSDLVNTFLTKARN